MVGEVGEALSDAVVVEGQGDQFQLAFALMEIILNKVGRVEGLVRGSRATEVGDRCQAIFFFLGAMGWDEADTKVRKANKLNLDKAKLQLDGVSDNRKLARFLGKDGLEERRQRLAGESGPALEKAEAEDTGARMIRTAAFAVEMCSDLLTILEHFASGDAETGTRKRMALVDKWNAFGEENFIREGRNVLKMPLLCVHCGRPLVLVAPGGKKTKSEFSSARTHPWCRGAKKQQNRRLKLKLTSQT